MEAINASEPDAFVGSRLVPVVLARQPISRPRAAHKN